MALLHDERVLDINTDCAEFCPHPEHLHVLAVAAYQLDEATQQRVGRLSLFATGACDSAYKLQEVASKDEVGIFDAKWRCSGTGMQLGLALADGSLALVDVLVSIWTAQAANTLRCHDLCDDCIYQARNELMCLVSKHDCCACCQEAAPGVPPTAQPSSFKPLPRIAMTTKHPIDINTTCNVSAVLLVHCSIKKMARTSCSSTAAARQSQMPWPCSLTGNPPAAAGAAVPHMKAAANPQAACKQKLRAIIPAAQPHLVVMLVQMMLAPHHHHQHQRQQSHQGHQGHHQAAVRQSSAAQGETSAG